MSPCIPAAGVGGTPVLSVGLEYLCVLSACFCEIDVVVWVLRISLVLGVKPMKRLGTMKRSYVLFIDKKNTS